MKKKLSWDSRCFYVNGEPTPLISGEFHYFRVPHDAWRDRLLLLKESGANTVATYIPWIVHEPEEGRILFDDIPQRSLTEFLSLCCELELMVIARPGPYCYSELRCDGLPVWLVEKYPRLHAYRITGPADSASYLHPLFLEKARRYIRAANEKIRPFLVTNGGCVVSVQVDNELGGLEIWRGFLDCNPETIGVGREDGRFARFLTGKYGSLAGVNQAYGTDFVSLAEIDPFHNTPKDDVTGGKRFRLDYSAFYKTMLEEYVDVVSGWFEEDGIDVDYCTNAGSHAILCLLRHMPEQQKKRNFYVGTDHYYALTPSKGWGMNPEKTYSYAFSLDMLCSIGMPPAILEMQSGSSSAFPPVLPEELKCFYMMHVAYGMKGSNYYVFTGGPNFEGTGNNVDVYDYHAPISAEGAIRPIYYAQKKRNLFSRENSWLLTTPRSCDLQIGFSWEHFTLNGNWDRYERDGLHALSHQKALGLSLGLNAWLYRFCELGCSPDPTLPLIAVCDDRMSKEKQENLVSYVQQGGRLILTPVVPEMDEDFMPCTVLKDFLGVTETRLLTKKELPIVTEQGVKVYSFERHYAFDGFCGRSLAKSESCGESVIEYKQIGGGQVVLLGVDFIYNQYYQTDMVNECLAVMGCEKRVETDCHELNVTLYEGDGQTLCFIINAFSGTVCADMTVHTSRGAVHLTNLSVPPHTVLPIKLFDTEETYGNEKEHV